MKTQRIILSTLLTVAISPALFAAGHYKKMDECILVYSATKSEEPITTGIGDSFLNIRNMHKLTTKASGELTFFYGKNSITILADTAGQNDVIDEFQDCSEVPD